MAPISLFSEVLAVLQKHQFNAFELASMAHRTDGKVFSKGLGELQETPENVPKFCAILEQSNDACNFVTVAEAARQQNQLSLAEDIESALLKVCLKLSPSDEELDVKKKVFETLVAMLERNHLKERAADFNKQLENVVVNWFIEKQGGDKEASKRKVSSGFKAFNVNRIDDHYLPRPTVEKEILEKLKIVAEKPNAGVLAVKGCAGIGKTTTMSYLMAMDKTSQEFLANQCNLHIGIWLNCFQWRDSFEKDDSLLFESKLISSCREAVPDIPADMTDLTAIVAHLESVLNTRPLFILDDMVNPDLLQYFREKCPDAVCCILTHDIFKIFLRGKSTLTSNLLGAVIEIPELGDEEVFAMLSKTYNLQGKFDDSQLQQLANHCLRLPLIANIVGHSFQSCLSDASLKTECEFLLHELSTTKEASSSQRQSETTTKLIELNIVRLAKDNETLKEMLYAFLLFEPNEPIHVRDLAMLWGCKTEKEALAISNIYAKLSLIKRLIIHHQNEEENNAKPSQMFLVHQTLHETVTSLAKSEGNVASLNELRLKILTNDIMFRIVEIQNRPLLERIFQNLNAVGLLEICRQIHPQKSGVTLLQFLFTWRWRDDTIAELNPWNTVRHSYRLISSILLKLRRDEEIATQAIGVVLGQKTAKTIAGKNSFLKQVLKVDWFTEHHNEDYKTMRGLLSPWLEGENEPSQLLIKAIRTGNVEVVKSLCQKYPNTVSMPCPKYGRSQLAYAAWSGNIAIVKYLFEKYPKAVQMSNRRHGRSPLSYAAWNGHIEVVQFLYEKYPQAAETVCKDGRTPLSYAAVRGHVEVLCFLYEKYPKAVEISCKAYGRTPLSYAASTNHLKVVQFLFEKYPEAIKMQCTKYGRTPLSYAAWNGHFEVVQFLCEMYPEAAEITCEKYGQTPLSEAAERGNTEVVRFLYEKYPKAAEILCKKYGQTPLSYAASHGHLEVVKFLFEKCPKTAKLPSAKSGRTPLQYAQFFHKKQVVAFLLSPDDDAANKTTS